MWIGVVAAGMLSLILAHSFFTEYMAKEIPWNANETARDVGNFHVFALAAELYMRDHAADASYLPANTTVVRWDAYKNASNLDVKGLKDAKGLPPGLQSANIDSTWRIEIIGSRYVLCTGMSMGSVAQMARLPDSPLWNPGIVWQQGNLTLTNGVSTFPAVTFGVDNTSANYCK